MSKKKDLKPIERVRKLQRSSILYSALGIFFISLIVALFSSVPLYNKLQRGEERNLQFSLHLRALVIEEFLSRAKDIAEQISSRTKARQLLEDYNQRKINREEAGESITRILTDALNQSEDVVGIRRVAQDGALLAQMGLPVPDEFRSQLARNLKHIVLSNPIQLKGGGFYLLVQNPIFDRNKQIIGTDIVLFRAYKLQKIIQDSQKIGQTSQTIIGTVQNNQVEIFFQYNNISKKPSEEILNAISKAVSGERGFLRIEKSILHSKILFYQSLINSHWGLAIEIESQELYAPVHQQLVLIGTTIVLLSGLGTGGMILLLRPLSNQVLIHTDELEYQVKEKIAAIEKLKKTQAQLIQTEKMSGLGLLVAGVAHEINNPIAFIYGNLKHAEEYTKNLLGLVDCYQNKETKSATEIEEYIETIDLEFLKVDLPKLVNSMQEGATRIRDIVLSLKNFSRTDEVGMKVSDLHEGIESTLLILQHRLKAQPDRPQIQVIKKYGNLPQVECHMNKLNQVFMNLLVNAIDALESDNLQPSSNGCQANSKAITIHTQPFESNWIAVCITDNGPGITQTVINRLFEPFFTTKTVGKGTGLGLSISYQIIVEQHGGKLWCDSTLGQGTEFTIQIPIRQEIVKPLSNHSSQTVLKAN